MKILHLMLSCFYIDNGNYQENVIPRQNKKDGHRVEIIASTEVFINSKLSYTKPGSYLNEDGIKVRRLPYKNVLYFGISKKVRAYPGLYKLIDDFAPDIILFHGAAAYALLTAAKYKKNNPQVKFYVDSHEDYNNSATNFLSKYVLHKIFYRGIIRKSLKYIDKVLYITYESAVYLKEMYSISDKYLLFFPLGGNIPEPDKREYIRNKIRSSFDIDENQILLIISGKFDKIKRTVDVIKAFIEVPNQNLRLIIIGSMDKDICEAAMRLINSDSRIHYLGWLNSSLLQDYLCAGDLYVQLGSQSVTMQNALCCGNAAALYPFESHKFLLKESVFYIEQKEDLIKVIKMISSEKSILEKKRKESFEIAKRILDYEKITAIIYNN